MNEKHAYLILAHQTDLTLQTLLRLLDDERNDIYIHMDAKNTGYTPAFAEACVTKSRVFHTDRLNVVWGGFGLVKAELLLLKAATREHYAYYHLLSGQDLPLRSQQEIHAFFDAVPPTEYIGIADGPGIENTIEARVRCRHFFRERIGKPYYLSGSQAGFGKKLLDFTERKLISLQLHFPVHRNAKITFAKGSQWFSITDDMARYVVDREKWVYTHFRQTLCPDELFMQTLLINSPYRDRRNPGAEIPSSLRLIDWARGAAGSGSPYTFRLADYDMLVSSDMLFARKFSASTDAEIIEKLRDHILTDE